MKKRLILFAMLTCMICLAACGKDEAVNGPISQEAALNNGTEIVNRLHAVVSGKMIEQYADDPVSYNGCLGWESALTDIGEYEGVSGASVYYKDGGAVITVSVLGSSHNAEVEILLDDTYTRITGITTNVQYSLGEILIKAGLNTLIGMGTVFVVLILISLIISCFTLISKLEKKQKKKEEPAPAQSPVVQQIAAKEELSDDTELVAVIAAAIAAYEGAASTDGFVVRSIRKSNKSKWQNA